MLYDDLWRLTKNSQALPRLVVRLVFIFYTTDQDLQVIGGHIVVVSGRKFGVTQALMTSLGKAARTNEN